MKYEILKITKLLKEKSIIILKHPFTVFLFLALFIVLLSDYAVNEWGVKTGFEDYKNSYNNAITGKTLWDWLDLLIVPLVLALGAWFLKRADSKLERDIAKERIQEAALEKYFDSMSTLLLHRNSPLLKSKRDSACQDLAFTRTLAVLRRLEEKRRNFVFNFLRDARLLEINNNGVSNKANDEENEVEVASDRIALFSARNLNDVNLNGAELWDADLSAAKLRHAELSGADLSGADLSGADLTGANLSGARLTGANLSGASLFMANFSGASLFMANFSGASLTDANLSKAYLVKANLCGAKLVGANLKTAKIKATQLKEADNLKGALFNRKVKKELIEAGIEIRWPHNKEPKRKYYKRNFFTSLKKAFRA